VVEGIDATPEDERPSLAIHTLFDVKMTLVNILMVLIPGYFALYFFKRHWLKKRLALYALGVSGLLAVVIVELGWMLTEIGRQPWAVRGYVTTAEALTKTHDVTNFGYAFPLAYVCLFTVTILGIRKLIVDECAHKGSTLV
jgi:cytochrome d ubiquinol oxidase subunit I